MLPSLLLNWLISTGKAAPFLSIPVIFSAAAQINLGQFGFHPTGNGGWDLGLGQSANILGFGGDRGLKLGQGPNGFGLQSEPSIYWNFQALRGREEDGFLVAATKGGAGDLWGSRRGTWRSEGWWKSKSQCAALK